MIGQTNRGRLALSMALVLSSACLGGCLLDRPCTDAYRPSTINIEFSELVTSPGLYTMTTIKDGRVDVCEFDYVELNSTRDCSINTCLVYYDAYYDADCSWRRVEWKGVRDDVPGIEEITIEFQNENPPTDFEVRLERDGVLIGSRSLRPTTVSDTPNGPGCGTRHTTSFGLTVTSP